MTIVKINNNNEYSLSVFFSNPQSKDPTFKCKVDSRYLEIQSSNQYIIKCFTINPTRYCKIINVVVIDDRRSKSPVDDKINFYFTVNNKLSSASFLIKQQQNVFPIVLCMQTFKQIKVIMSSSLFR